MTDPPVTANYVAASYAASAGDSTIQEVGCGRSAGGRVGASGGFVALYTIFTLLYAHAYRLRDALGLNAMEVHETYGVTRQHVAMTLIGVLSLALAFLEQPALSGMSYFLISPAMGVLGWMHGRRRKTLMAERDRLAAA